MTFLVYLPALQNGFVNLDDSVYVYDNKDIQSMDFRLLVWIFTPEANATWHPLTMFSLALDHAIWRLNPFGYHLTNILFHSLNTFMVFILVVRLIKCKHNPSSLIPHPSSLIAAFVTALLFGIHPLHVESVAWISERKDVLYAFFFLSSLLAYLKYTSAASSRRSGLYITCLVSFLLALMSKPMAVSLPFVLLILDFYPLRRLMTASDVLREKIPFLAFSLLSSLIAIWAQSLGSALQTLEDYPFAERIFIAVRAFAFYLLKMALPSNLAPYYPHPAEIDFFTIEYVGSFIFLVLITAFCILSLKRFRLFSAVWLYYIVTLIPVIGIVKVGGHSMADRYTYLPSLGPFLFAGLGVGILFERYSEKWHQIALALALIFLLSILGSRAMMQMAVWKDSISLWSHEIKLLPDFAYVAYDRRGNTYNKLGNYQQAIKDFDKSILLNPKYPEAYHNRGTAYREIGEQQLAIKDFDTAIKLSPKYTEAYYNRGNAHNSLGNYQQAIKDFSEVIKLNPPLTRLVIAYNNRGVAYRSLGIYKEAIKDFNTAIAINPGYQKAYNNRGITYMILNDHSEAIKDFNMAIKLNTGDTMAYKNRGIAYKNLGNHEQAMKDFNRADELKHR